MNLKKSMKKIAVVGLTGIALMAGLVVSAETISAKTNAAAETYVAVPMGMFKMLKGEKKSEKCSEVYTYNDGKLAKCNADLSKVMKKNCEKKEKYCKDQKKSRECRSSRKYKEHGDYHKRMQCMKDFHKGDGKVVLLTIDQLDNLRQQRVQDKLDKLKNRSDKMSECLTKASDNAQTFKIDGKDAKIITMKDIKDSFCKKDNCPMMKKGPAEPSAQE